MVEKNVTHNRGIEERMLNIILPQSWQELTQKQLRWVFKVLTTDLSAVEVQTVFLLRFGHIRVLRREGALYVVRHDKKEYTVSAQQIAECLGHLRWLCDIPAFPVRPERFGYHRALPATFQEIPFETFLYLDNLYQGYLHTQKKEILNEMGAILYNAKSLRLSRWQGISVFYWFSSLKQYFARTFTHFFTSVDTNDNSMGGSGNIGQKLMESMNAQIRALTGGDITKEKQVLKMDTWRALTELDAKARDYEEMKRLTYPGPPQGRGIV